MKVTINTALFNPLYTIFALVAMLYMKMASCLPYVCGIKDCYRHIQYNTLLSSASWLMTPFGQFSIDAMKESGYLLLTDADVFIRVLEYQFTLDECMLEWTSEQQTPFNLRKV